MKKPSNIFNLTNPQKFKKKKKPEEKVDFAVLELQGRKIELTNWQFL